MVVSTQESAFEAAIEGHLLKNGYFKGDPASFDANLGFDPTLYLKFIQSTQPESYEKLISIHGGDTDRNIIARLAKELDQKGMLDVLRTGIDTHGVHLDTVHFRPASKMNPEAEKQYAANILSVARQVHHSVRHPNQSIDLLLSVNGLPVATVELKNPLTGQNYQHAISQYRNDRDPRDKIFEYKKRALVHFAVDPNEVWMTTKLTGKSTRFLPFNRGNEGGAGNPSSDTSYRTAYLWEAVWQKDSWLDILQRFIHHEVREEFDDDGQVQKKEAIIFPRYHQLDCVRKLVADAQKKGSGQNYLIQHSAGSGKSNSIAWLAHHLSDLHDESDQPVFNSVIVVTDRVVLDEQLQENIYQFEQVSGVVERIDKNSAQLASALETGKKIIITTVQKFPYALEKMASVPNSKYACIIDEAHSSQSGETSKKMKEVLMGSESEDSEEEAEEDYQEEILKSVRARGRQENVSFFAFTATPKAKTLEVFGSKGPDGKPEPFHLYSMRQAIEEGFILDVLQNYTTYKTYFNCVKKIEEKEYDKTKAQRAFARFITLHPHNVAQKAEVIVEHYRQNVPQLINGRAKAMVVTGSRPQALAYYKGIKGYIKEKGYDIGVLVAFSDFTQNGRKETESEYNGFPEKELRGKFATREYKILVVADKYQTGFDQPLLHTMYVDKKLSGVKAVQTLSRLNRSHPGKEDTFVLDFLNTEEEIQASFQPFYQKTRLKEETDPDLLYDLRGEIEAFRVIQKEEIELFCKVFFKPGSKEKLSDHGKLCQRLQPAVDRFNALESGSQEEFKRKLTAFNRLYSFVSQFMPFQDTNLEKFYAFTRSLARVLPRDPTSPPLDLNNDIALAYYRIRKTGEGSILLESEDGQVQGPKTPGSGDTEEDKITLSEFIEQLNERFGTEFTEADKLYFEQIEEELIANPELKSSASANPIDSFKYDFDDKFEDSVISRMEKNSDISRKILDDQDFQRQVTAMIMQRVYRRLKEGAA